MTSDVAFQVRYITRGSCPLPRGGDPDNITTRVNGLAKIRAAAADA